MKKVSVCSFIICLILIVACNDENENVLQENDLVAVQFRSGPTVMTKVSGDEWDAGDKIGIYMVKNKTDFVLGSILDNIWNIPYVTTGGDGVFEPVPGGGTIYYPVDGSKVDFYAYYPYQESMKEFLNIPIYGIDINDQSDLAALDLLYSKNVKGKHKNDSEVQLDFRHILHKITLNIQPGEGLSIEDFADMTVSVKNIYKRGDFGFQTENITVTSLLPGDISKKTTLIEDAGKHRVQLLILPQTALSKACIEFKLPGSKDSYYYEFASDHKFVTGQHIEYTVILNKTEALVEGNILEWDKLERDPENIN